MLNYEYLKFLNFVRKIRLLFIIFVDFESILVFEDNGKQKFKWALC